MNNSRFDKAASVLLAVTVVQGTCGVSAFAAETIPAPTTGIVVMGGDVEIKSGGFYAACARKIVSSGAKSCGTDLTKSRVDAFTFALGGKSAEAATQYIRRTSARHDVRPSLANKDSALPAKRADFVKSGTLRSDPRSELISGGVSRPVTADAITAPKSGFS